MSNTGETKRHEAQARVKTKKNNTYKSIQEYFSDLDFYIGVEDTEAFSNVDDIYHYFKCYETLLKHHNIEFKYDHFENTRDLLLAVHELNTKVKKVSFNRSFVPGHDYKKDEKHIEGRLGNMSRINQVLAYIWIEPFFEMRDYVEPEFWNQCAYHIYQEYKRAVFTEAFDLSCGEYAFDRAIEMGDYDDGDYNFYLQLLKFNSLLNEIKDIKKVHISKAKFKKYSKKKQKLLKALSAINNYCYEVASNAMNIDRHCEAWEGTIDMDEGQEPVPDEYLQELACGRYYSGQYLLGLREECAISTDILGMVNEISNNGYWDMHLSERIIYTENNVIRPDTDIVKYTNEHMDNYFLVNELIEKITSYAKIRKNISNRNNNCV